MLIKNSHGFPVEKEESVILTCSLLFGAEDTVLFYVIKCLFDT